MAKNDIEAKDVAKALLAGSALGAGFYLFGGVVDQFVQITAFNSGAAGFALGFASKLVDSIL